MIGSTKLEDIKSNTLLKDWHESPLKSSLNVKNEREEEFSKIKILMVVIKTRGNFLLRESSPVFECSPYN